MIKIVKTLFFVVALIQLNQFFAVTGSLSSEDHAIEDPNVLVPALRLQSMSLPLNSNSNLNGHPTTSQPSSSSPLINSKQSNDQPEKFTKWNDYLKEFVREKIPDIKPNRALRDYLTRLDIWAPKRLKLEYAQRCENKENNYRWVNFGNDRQPDLIKKSKYMWWAYYVLNDAINKFYIRLQIKCDKKGLVNESALLIAHEINKFFVLKSINEHIEKVSKAERDEDPEHEWNATMKALDYIKNIEPLPCPYFYEPVN